MLCFTYTGDNILQTDVSKGRCAKVFFAKNNDNNKIIAKVYLLIIYDIEHFICSELTPFICMHTYIYSMCVSIYIYLCYIYIMLQCHNNISVSNVK